MRISTLISAAVAAATFAAAPLQAKDPKNVLMPEDPDRRAFQEAVGYAEVVIAGDTIYLAGVVAASKPGETGGAPAYDRAFKRIEAALARAGADWDDVVDMTTYHMDIAGQINEFAEVKNRYIKAPFPAWTALGISALYGENALVEIKIVAHKEK